MAAPTMCPKCKVALASSGRLLWCTRCAYEPPESGHVQIQVVTKADADALARPERTAHPMWKRVVEATAEGCVVLAVGQLGMSQAVVRQRVRDTARRKDMNLERFYFSVRLSRDSQSFIIERRPRPGPGAAK